MNCFVSLRLMDYFVQKLLRELEDKISSTEQSLVAKEIDRKQLERHAEDARK